MTKPKRQRTIAATLKDKQTGWTLFASIRVERRRITLHPHPGLYVTVTANGNPPPVERLEARALRLGQRLQQRWWGKPS